jgi:hypothetical protein
LGEAVDHVPIHQRPFKHHIHGDSDGKNRPSPREPSFDEFVHARFAQISHHVGKLTIANDNKPVGIRDGVSVTRESCGRAGGV